MPAEAVEHLVVDSTAFINNAPLQKLGKSLYTIAEVIGELRDREVRERVRNLPYEVQLKTASVESLRMGLVTEASKKTGDYPTLSSTDLKLLAVTHDLHTLHCGKDGINYDIKTSVQVVDEEREVKRPFGFHNQAVEQEEGEESEEEDWVGEDNFGEALSETAGIEAKKEAPVVACLTNDFSIQNVLLHMRMGICSADGQLIKRLNTYVLRCRACYTTTPNMTKEFCPKCGHKSLHQVSVTVDEEGVQHLHIDFERLRVKRGMKHSIKSPKGGKHGVSERVFEDQKLAHNRMARGLQCLLDSSPFSLNDVTSRSSLLGLRPTNRHPNESNQRGRRN